MQHGKEQGYSAEPGTRQRAGEIMEKAAGKPPPTANFSIAAA